MRRFGYCCLLIHVVLICMRWYFVLGYGYVAFGIWFLEAGCMGVWLWLFAWCA